MQASRIAIVEDEAIVALDIQDRLAAMGYALAGRADTGEQALVMAEQQKPDLFLMDIRLRGDMDGITTAREIRRRFHLPVIFLTAYSEEDTLEKAKKAEPYGFILKPFDDRELKSAVEIALYKHRAEEEIRRLNRLYDVLSQVNQTVVRTGSREKLFQEVCRLVVERGEIDLAWIGWIQPESPCITPIASFGEQQEMLNRVAFFMDARPEGQGNPGKALREGFPFICNECGKNNCLYPENNAPKRFGLHSCGAFPIRFQGEVRGVLNICVQEAGFFKDREIELLKEVAVDLSFALDKIEGDDGRKEAEKALRASESKFRSYIEHAPIGVFVADGRGNFVDVNSAAAAMLGYSEPELLGLSIPQVHPPEWLAEGMEKFQEVVREGFTSVELLLQKKDGSPVWGALHAVRLNDGRVLSFCQDITERKKAEEARLEGEARFRTLVEGAPEGILVQQEGRIAYVNRAMCSLLGSVDPAELQGREFNTLVASEYQSMKLYRRPLQEQTGKAAPLTEQEYLRLDGSRVPVETTAVPFKFQGKDAILVYIRDITERKQAEQALHQSEERFRLAMEATRDGLWDWDLATNKVYYSPGYFRMLG
ncbi:MAG TPA: PAS domain S-box protein, partial [Thermodesulfobacteriota bacterium]|nr:PAS domain S-box protein [Thermodesulfobacteriota bacterium]